MVFRSVRWVFVMGVVAALCHGTAGPAWGQNPAFEIRLAYNQASSLRTSAAVAVDGYTSSYDTLVPFKLLYNTEDSPFGINYRVWSDDGWIDDSGSLAGQNQGTLGYSIPARLLNRLKLNGEAYDPMLGTLVATTSLA